MLSYYKLFVSSAFSWTVRPVRAEMVCLIPSGVPSARKEKEWREGRKARRKGKKEGGFG